MKQYVSLKLTEEIKFEAVVVTVARAEEEECRRALAKNVHITALQVNRRPPQRSRRGICNCNEFGADFSPLF